MDSGDTGYSILELEHAQKEAVVMNICRFFQMLEDLPPEVVGEEDDTPEMADHVVRFWHAADENDRMSEDDMVCMIGCTLGDYLRHFFHLEWKMVRHADETLELSLVGEVPDDRVTDGKAPKEMVLSPLSSVGKRLRDNPDGFVAEFLDGLGEHLMPLVREEPLQPNLPFGFGGDADMGDDKDRV
jgi:hypothetical protein